MDGETNDYITDPSDYDSDNDGLLDGFNIVVTISGGTYTYRYNNYDPVNEFFDYTDSGVLFTKFKNPSDSADPEQIPIVYEEVTDVYTFFGERDIGTHPNEPDDDADGALDGEDIDPLHNLKVKMDFSYFLLDEGALPDWLQGVGTINLRFKCYSNGDEYDAPIQQVDLADAMPPGGVYVSIEVEVDVSDNKIHYNDEDDPGDNFKNGHDMIDIDIEAAHDGLILYSRFDVDGVNIGIGSQGNPYEYLRCLVIYQLKKGFEYYDTGGAEGDNIWTGEDGGDGITNGKDDGDPSEQRDAEINFQISIGW